MSSTCALFEQVATFGHWLDNVVPLVCAKNAHSKKSLHIVQ